MTNGTILNPTTASAATPAASHAPLWIASAMAILLALVPLVIHDAFTLQVLLLAILFGGLGSCWNLVGGFLGRISFGHSVFVGVGGYTTFLLLRHLHLTPLIGIPVGGAVCALLAYLVGGRHCAWQAITSPWRRSRLLQIALLLVVNWDWAGGAIGLEAPLGNEPWMLLFPGKVPYYLIAVVLAFLTFLTTYLLVRSKTGFYWRAINGDEGAARSLGVPADRYKMLAFVLSAAMTGVWGGFFALYVGVIDPDSMFNLTFSVQIVLVTILGGVGHFDRPPGWAPPCCCRCRKRRAYCGAVQAQAWTCWSSGWPFCW